MADTQDFDLVMLFQGILAALRRERENLNRVDEINQNHGDHMVSIFEVAVKAAEERRDADLADKIEYAANSLSALRANGSAQEYQRGLRILAEQFRQRDIGFDTLLPYVRSASREKTQTGDGQDDLRSAEVLKALLSALSAWDKDAQLQDSGMAVKTGDLDIGYLMGMGIAFMQAKQKGGDRLDVLAETAVSATPLVRVPHRHRSGKLVMRTLLATVSQTGEKDA